MKVDKTKWEYKKLGDICQIQTGKLDANAKVENGQYPFFTCDYKPYRIDKYAFDTEAILISGNGSLVGHVNYYNGKFNAYQRTYVLTQFKLFYIPYLIIYLKRNLRPYIIQNKKGGCIPYITLPILKNFKILYPSLYEQRDIAAELDAVQKMIEGYKAQLADLDTLGQSIFLDMFGDPITNPKGWNTKSINEVTQSRISNQTIEIKGGKYWLLNLDKIQAGTGKILSYDYVDENKIGPSTFPFDNTMILYSKLRPYLNKVIAPTRSGYATTELVPFIPNKILHKIYFLYLLRNESMVRALNSTAGGARMPRTKMDIMRILKIPVPPLPLQQQFAERVEAIERQKELLQAQLAEAQTLMAERMQYYFD